MAEDHAQDMGPSPFAVGTNDRGTFAEIDLGLSARLALDPSEGQRAGAAQSLDEPPDAVLLRPKAVLGDQVLVDSFGRETLLQLGQNDGPKRRASALAGRSRSLIRARRPGRGVSSDRRVGRRSIRRCRFL
ncbi:MAG: hypothetical protein ACE5I3_10075 [Phycisphaerae bacterium]